MFWGLERGLGARTRATVLAGALWTGLVVIFSREQINKQTSMLSRHQVNGAQSDDGVFIIAFNNNIRKYKLQ